MCSRMNEVASIDLNCDFGEHDHMADIDRRLAEIVTSANIACGGHAGDRGSMERTIRLCSEMGVAVGAHPSYPDREHFGRRAIVMNAEELENALVAQLSEFALAARAVGVPVRHVKPHGALYHAAMTDDTVGRVVWQSVRRVFPACALVGLAGSAMLGQWQRWGSEVVIAEAFAERAYEPDGTLRSRSLPGALIEDPVEAGRQAVEIAARARARATSGDWIAVRAQSICVHGDSPNAVETARAVRTSLESAGIAVKAVKAVDQRRPC
ncbi:MAG: hypothetical protein GIKADHBN_01691 [Phycisphaerales bacterium]|nr:hypothetical protein [Phycisphaerales bacterium]